MNQQRRTHSGSEEGRAEIGVLPIRWCAYIIDLSLLAGPGMMVGAVLVDRVISRMREASTAGLQPNYELSFVIQALLNGVAPLLAWALFQLLLGIAYFSLFESSRLQATPGKLFLGLHVVNRDEERVGLDQAFVRGVARAASTFPFVVGTGLAVKLNHGATTAQHGTTVLIVSILLSLLLLAIHYPLAVFTRERQALHDLVAGTTVRIGRRMSRHETLARMAFVAPFCLCAGLVLSFLNPAQRSTATIPPASLVLPLGPLPGHTLARADWSSERARLALKAYNSDSSLMQQKIRRSGQAAIVYQSEIRIGMSVALANRMLGAPGILRLSRQVTRFTFPRFDPQSGPLPSLFADSTGHVVDTLGISADLGAQEKTRSNYEQALARVATPGQTGLYQVFHWNFPDGSSLRATFFKGSLLSKRPLGRRSLLRSRNAQPCEPTGIRAAPGCEDVFGDGIITPLIGRSCPILGTRTTLKLCGARGCQSTRTTTVACASSARKCALFQVEDADIAECLAAQARGDLIEDG